MNPLDHRLKRRNAIRWIEAEQAVSPLRIVGDLVCGRPPGPATNLAQRFGRREIGFVPPQRLLRLLALGDVAYQAQKPTFAGLLKIADANFHRERSPILSQVAGLESNRFAGDEALLHALD